MAKGSDYEREICNMFSRWWTHGKRDDIFWRAAASGARAKVRGRGGRGTAGQHGDICATDPLGAPLIDFLTIEIKRGYSAESVQALIDKPDNAAAGQWDLFLDQVIESWEYAGSYTWALIHRRDRREAMIWLPAHVVNAMRTYGGFATQPTPYVRMAVVVRRAKYNESLTIAGMRLKDFFTGVTPEQLRGLAKEV